MHLAESQKARRRCVDQTPGHMRVGAQRYPQTSHNPHFHIFSIIIIHRLYQVYPHSIPENHGSSYSL